MAENTVEFADWALLPIPHGYSGVGHSFTHDAVQGALAVSGHLPICKLNAGPVRIIGVSRGHLSASPVALYIDDKMFKLRRIRLESANSMSVSILG